MTSLQQTGERLRSSHDSLNRYLSQHAWHGRLLALLAGLLITPALAPFHLWPLAILSPLLLLLCWQNISKHETVWRGWAYGFGLWLAGASWLYVSIHTYGYTPLPLAVLLMALVAAIMGLLTALQGWCYARFGIARYSLPGFAALWVLFEWLRSWLFTGFPWLYDGYAFLDTPLAGYAPLTGVWGLSFLSCLSGALLLRSWQYAHRPLITSACLLTITGIWSTGAWLQQQQWTHVDKQRPITVSLVQGDIPQEAKWQLEWRDKTVAIYENLTRSEWGRDLVIWPEAAIPMFFHEAIDTLTALDEKANDNKTAFVTGIPYYELRSQGRFFNSVLAIGNGSGLYHKQRLVPFGEYVPFENALRGLIPLFNLEMSSFTVGAPNQPALQINTATGPLHLASLICYEIVYPELVRNYASRTELMLTISNDAWFGSSHGPLQHFEMVRMRALENGRYILRGTNNGLTGITDPQGKVVALAPQFQRTVLRGTVYPADGLTPYLRWGAGPLLLLCFIAVMFCAWQQRRHNRQLPTPPSPPSPTPADAS